MSTTEPMTVTYPALRVGIRGRRGVRHAVRSAKVLGAKVHFSERRHLTHSQFTIRAIGSDDEVAPLMTLTQLHRPSKETP